MATIISVTNLKGGVGKTTSTVNIGAALATMGYKVMVVDWDPQGNTSQHMGISNLDEAHVLIDAMDSELPGFHDPKKLAPYSMEKYPENLFLLANDYRLANFESKFPASLPGFHFALKKVLENFKDGLDFILIDCQPSLSPLTINAYCASDKLLIPMEVGSFAKKGLNTIEYNVSQINEYLGGKLEIAGIFFARHNPKTVISKNYSDYYKDETDLTLYNTVIRENVALKECKELGFDIFSYDRFATDQSKKEQISLGSEDYYDLTNEILVNFGFKEKAEIARDQTKKVETPIGKKSKKGDLSEEFKNFLNG